MNNLLAFWQRRGTAARIGLVFLLLCIVNWTRLAIKGEFHPMTPAVTSVSLREQPAAAEPANTGSFDSGPGITMQRYGELRTGMTYRQAVATLGAEGVEMSSNDIGGSHTVMYQWKAGMMANMNAMFQNDKLISKAQFGLK